MLAGIVNKLAGLSTSVELRACGIFYRLSSTYYFLPTVDIPPNTVLTKGEPLPLSGMFSVWFAHDPKGEKVGFLISSSFPMIDKGGVLITRLTKGMGKASVVEVLLKTKDMILYHFPNKGTMAISPKIGDSMSVILEEQ